jgi:hypothetical protein
MGLPILAECLHHLWVGLVSIGLERIDDQPETAVRHDGALQCRIGLEADDDFVFTVDVAGRVGRDGTGDLRDVEYALSSLLDEHLFERVPDSLRAPGGRRQE